MSFSKQYPRTQQTFCNIEPSPGDYVYGCLLWLDPKSFRALDRFEGYPVHYQRVKLHAPSGQPCWAYISDHKGKGAPSVEYYESVIDGLKMCGANDDYLRQVIRDAAERFEREDAELQFFYEPEYLPAKYRLREEVAMW